MLKRAARLVESPVLGTLSYSGLLGSVGITGSGSVGVGSTGITGMTTVLLLKTIELNIKLTIIDYWTNFINKKSGKYTLSANMQI